MNLSFKEFATQFTLLPLPVSALTVAGAVTPPMLVPLSFRALIGQGAPYTPDCSGSGPFFDNSVPNVVAFFWADGANLPPWLYDPDVNSLRLATSWLFELWDAVGNAKLVSQTVPLSAFSIAYDYRAQYDYPHALHGDYVARVTAFNNYGSAPTPLIPVTIAPPPTLAVQHSPANTNTFVVIGAHFPPGQSVSIEVDAGTTFGTALLPTPPAVSVQATGAFETEINCQSLSTQVQGGFVRFSALVGGTVLVTTTSSFV